MRGVLVLLASQEVRFLVFARQAEIDPSVAGCGVTGAADAEGPRTADLAARGVQVVRAQPLAPAFLHSSLANKAVHEPGADLIAERALQVRVAERAGHVHVAVGARTATAAAAGALVAVEGAVFAHTAVATSRHDWH